MQQKDARENPRRLNRLNIYIGRFCGEPVGREWVRVLVGKAYMLSLPTPYKRPMDAFLSGVFNNPIFPNHRHLDFPRIFQFGLNVFRDLFRDFARVNV